MSYTPNVKVIVCGQKTPDDMTGIHFESVSCARQFEAEKFLDAFLGRSDGVLVVGCRTADCKNTAGKIQTGRKVEILRELLEETDLRGRLRVHWLHHAEKGIVREMAEQFVGELRERGPVHYTPRLELALEAMKEMLESRRIRNYVAKYHPLVEKSNVFGDKLQQADVDAGLKEAVGAEYARALIHCMAARKPVSVEETAEMFGLPPQDVLRHVSAMLKRNMIELSETEGNVPRYAAMKKGGGE
jgi:coenzyme F420-reducing hydrogenase delta subunit